MKLPHGTHSGPLTTAAAISSSHGRHAQAEPAQVGLNLSPFTQACQPLYAFGYLSPDPDPRGNDDSLLLGRASRSVDAIAGLGIFDDELQLDTAGDDYDQCDSSTSPGLPLLSSLVRSPSMPAISTFKLHRAYEPGHSTRRVQTNSNVNSPRILHFTSYPFSPDHQASLAPKESPPFESIHWFPPMQPPCGLFAEYPATYRLVDLRGVTTSSQAELAKQDPCSRPGKFHLKRLGGKRILRSVTNLRRMFSLGPEVEEGNSKGVKTKTGDLKEN